MLHFDQQNSKKSQRWPYKSQSGPRTRNYLARPEQRRLLGLVLMVGLVLFLMREVANPDRWKWMWWGVPAAEKKAQPQVDTRVKRVNHDVPDAFQIAAAPRAEQPEKQDVAPAESPKEAAEPLPETRGKEVDGTGAKETGANETPRKVEKKEATPETSATKDSAVNESPAKEAVPLQELKKPAAPARQNAPVARGKLFPGVDPSMFRETRDDTVFLLSDSEPFYHLCKILQDNDDKTLAEASTGQATFAQLYRQPKEYRGKLVTMRGKMLRAFRLPASKNEFGITETWQTWILPDNAQDHVQLYLLNLPPDFPVLEGGMKVQQQVEFTGFFFKLVAFKGGDAIRKVPLLVARDVTWIKPPPPAPPAEKMGPSTLVYAAFGAAVFSAALVFFVLFQTQRSNRIRAGSAEDKLVNEHLASLRNPPRNLPAEHEIHEGES